MTANEHTEIPEKVREYLASQPVMTLGTASAGGVAHATSLMYASDERALYVWMRPGTVTVQHLEENPSAAVTIDSYSDDWSKIKGVQASVDVEPLSDQADVARVVELFKTKFPNLTANDTTSLSFFALAPTQLHFIDNEASDSGDGAQTIGQSFHRDLIYSVFKDLPTAHVDALVGTLETTTFDEGAVIFREGDPADNFFIIVDGEVEVVQQGNATTHEITRLGPGQFFGEVAVLRDIPRTATVRAVTATTLLTMERDTFSSLVAQSLSTTADLHEIIRQRLERA